jgi:hypothetical protein
MLDRLAEWLASTSLCPRGTSEERRTVKLALLPRISDEGSEIELSIDGLPMLRFMFVMEPSLAMTKADAC